MPALDTRYLNGPAIDQILAEEDVSVSSLTDPDRVLWMLADHQGSIRDVADNTGTVVDHIFYDSYGNADEDHPEVQHTYGYAGYFRDEATGFLGTETRWYDPVTGRWTGEDWITFNGGSANLNEYVGNSPTNATDPKGLVAEGHHWTPINVIAKLHAEGLLSDEEYEYFSGRTSGPLGGGNPNVGYSSEHRCYDAAVEQELRDWKAAEDTTVTREKVIKHIKEGTTWDGRGTNKVINDFNSKVNKRTLDKKFDTVTDDDTIRKRGRSSLRGRGRLLAIIGTVGGTLAIANKAAQANDVARILCEGEGMKRAMNAALQGKRVTFEEALIGVGFANRSVYEELDAIDRVFAVVFRKAVVEALNNAE